MHTRELFHASVVVELAELSSVAQRQKFSRSIYIALERVKRRPPYTVLCGSGSSLGNRLRFYQDRDLRGLNGSCKFQSVFP